MLDFIQKQSKTRLAIAGGVLLILAVLMGIFAGGSLGGAIIGARDEVLSTSSYGFGELVRAIGE